MDVTYIILAVSGLFFAGVVKGASGLGYSSCALPFLTAIVGLKSAIVLVVLPAMVSNLAVIISTGHFRETLLRFWPFYLATFPGIWLGIQGLIFVDPKITELCLGILIIGYSIYSLSRPPLELPKLQENKYKIPSGFLNGVFTGLTGSQVLPLVPYMLALPLDPARTVQAINLSVTLASAFMIVALMNEGLMTTPALGLSIAAVAPALAGIYIGIKARALIPASQFKAVVLFILAGLGLLLVLRS